MSERRREGQSAIYNSYLVRSRTTGGGGAEGEERRERNQTNNKGKRETAEKPGEWKELTFLRWRTGSPARWFLQRARARAACRPPLVHLRCRLTLLFVIYSLPE